MSKQIDYAAVVGHLRPGAAYHYRGRQTNPGTGDLIPDTYDSIGQWRDPKTSKPTEAEIIAAWPEVQAEHSPEAIAQREAEREAERDADAKLVKSVARALKQQFPSLDLSQFRRDFISAYKQL